MKDDAVQIRLFLILVMIINILHKLTLLRNFLKITFSKVGNLISYILLWT